MNNNETSRRHPGQPSGEDLSAPLQILAERLEQEGHRTTALPSLEYRRELRRSLMNKYEAESSMAVRSQVLRLVGSAVALIIIGVAVFFTWQSLSTMSLPVAGGAPEESVQSTTAQVHPVATLTGYTLHVLPDSVEGEPTPTDPNRIELAIYWYYPGPETNLKTFVHVVDQAGSILAQTDVALVPQPEAQAVQTELANPDESSGAPRPNYIAEGVVEIPPSADTAQLTVVTGLYFDTITSQRLGVHALGTAQPVDQIALSNLPLPTGDSVGVTSASPGNGQFTGSDPITVEVEVSYRLESLDAAMLDVRLVTPMDGGGRGIATAQVPIQRGMGRLIVPVVLNPSYELNGPSDLGLWVQIKADERSAPVAVDMPATVQWHWEP